MQLFPTAHFEIANIPCDSPTTLPNVHSLRLLRAVVAVERDHLSLSAARHGSVPGPGGARQGWQGQLRFVRILSPSLPSQGELDLSQLRLAAAGTRRRLTERVRRPSRPASKRKKRLIDVDSTVATARVLSGGDVLVMFTKLDVREHLVTFANIW